MCFISFKKIRCVASPVLVLLLSASTLSGQQADQNRARGILSGQVVESISKKPLEYVNISLFRQQDTTLVQGGISQKDGRFHIGEVPRGTYRIRFSFMGFETLWLEDQRITEQEPVLHLGQLAMHPGTGMLDAVTVTADRAMLVFDLDKRVYAVGSDLTATGGSAIDVMEAIPSVSVDFEGRISLRGSQNVTILVDGRPSHFTGLDQVPATMIDRIEVITNPSARYDPDGTSGIINIILRKQRQRGTNGMANVNLGTGSKANGSVHLNHRIDRLNLFGNYDFRLQQMTGLNLNDQDRINQAGDTLVFIRQAEDFYRKGLFNNARLGADYFFSDRQVLSISATYNLRDTRPRNYSQVGLHIPEYRDLETSMERHFRGFGQEYVLSYSHGFGQNGGKLLADAFFSGSSGELARDVVVEPVASPQDREVMYEQSDAPGSLFSLQADLTVPLGGATLLETGLKTLGRNVEDDFRFFDRNPVTQQYDLNNTYSNHFLFRESIHSLYGILSHGFGKFRLQAGLRAEQHDIRTEQRTTGEESDRSLRNLFPSAHLRYAQDDAHSLSANYSKRVNRPSISMLNPFVNYSDPMNIGFGNPELQPEYIHSWELGYHYSANGRNVNTVFFYRQTNDIISRQMTLYSPDNPQTQTTFENLHHGISCGVELLAGLPLTRTWRFSGNLSYFNMRLEDDRLPDWKHEGDSWMIQGTSNWTILRRFDLQARFHYHSPTVTAGRTTGGGCQQHGGQGILNEVYYLDLALRTDVMRGNGTITLRLSDVFKTRTFDMYTYGDSFTSSLLRTTDSRVLFIGFTYRFNEYRQRQERDRGPSLLDELE
jgi:outer membrane receptor for ferrienterochelin and colicin